MNKYLVIGKNGYIAKAFAEKVFNEQVIYTTSGDEKGKAIYLDLTDPENFDYTIIDDQTTVLLLAANSSPDACLNNYDKAYQLNVRGTSAFIEKVLSKDARVLFFSSDTVYGEAEYDVDELSEVHPLGEYANMKYEVEQRFLGEKNFKVFRLSYVLSKHDKYMQYIVNCMKKSETAEVFEPLDRAVVYIHDVIDAIHSITTMWEQFTPSIVNLAGPEIVSRAVIARYVAELFPNELKFTVSCPSDEFYKARPRIINMRSRYLSDLIGHDATPIKQALELELEGMMK